VGVYYDVLRVGAHRGGVYGAAQCVVHCEGVWCVWVAQLYVELVRRACVQWIGVGTVFGGR
jgi:hypothetical protein